MPWRDVPAFVKAQLSELQPGDSARAALLLLIQTTVRSGEVRGATWEEFDLAARVWTIPAERMKANQPHRVPLSVKAELWIQGRRAPR
ncbi:MAG: tyrosine-type recombinase/integrase [Cupriavidus necator]